MILVVSFSYPVYNVCQSFLVLRLSYYSNTTYAPFNRHGVNPNQKLKAILEGCANLDHLWGSTLESHQLFSQDFFLPTVCICVLHTSPIFNPNSTLDRLFIMSSTVSTVALESTTNSPTTAWSKPNWPFALGANTKTCFVWAPIHLFACRSDFRCLELALIQEWQPRLNYPFICQFFHPKKGLLKRPAMNTNAQFGLATLWRRARHRFTPKAPTSAVAHHPRPWFQHQRPDFETTKMLRSTEGGLHLCYALRVLRPTFKNLTALSLQAIDNTIVWWKGKPAPPASALRAPWMMSPNLAKSLQSFLRQWYCRMIEHHVPCHVPSFKSSPNMPPWLILLCNHKSAIESWSLNDPPTCCCTDWSKFRSAALNPASGPWVLSGSLLTDLLAEGFSSKQGLPPKTGIPSPTSTRHSPMVQVQWSSIHSKHQIQDLGFTLWSSHTSHLTNHITRSSIQKLEHLFPGAVSTAKTNRLHPSEFSARVCTTRQLKRRFWTLMFLVKLTTLPDNVTSTAVSHSTTNIWPLLSLGRREGTKAPIGYILAKRRRILKVVVPSSPLWTPHFVLARMIFQLIPMLALVTLPQGTYIISFPFFVRPRTMAISNSTTKILLVSSPASINHGFPWCLAHAPRTFLRPHMDVSDNEVFSVYPGRFNNPGDLIKGRTFRRLNVTRKIIIKDIPSLILITTALNMQTFAWAIAACPQLRGSPMGSPLSPALCLMVVSISEQIWATNFKSILHNHHLFVRHIRYVDNRLILGDSRIHDLPPYESRLDNGFYGNPSSWKLNQTKNSVVSCQFETLFELIYFGPTNVSQVLSPFSASPPKVLLSGFPSRCHIVTKGAFPLHRVHQGLEQ